MLDNLFKFPIVMIDGDNEDRKADKSGLLNQETESEPDIIIGEAECPYQDFNSVCDRWLPTEESFQKALQGNFEACGVVFSNSGNYIVPWTKAKFKDKFRKFLDARPKEDIKLISLSKTELKDLLNGQDPEVSL